MSDRLNPEETPALVAEAMAPTGDVAKMSQPELRRLVDSLMRRNAAMARRLSTLKQQCAQSSSAIEVMAQALAAPASPNDVAVDVPDTPGEADA